MRKKNISKLIFIFLSLLFSGAYHTEASAQKCKYKVDEVDPMSEERIRRSKMTMDGRDFVVNFYRKGDEFSVEMEVALIGERNFVMPKGTELKLKLGNDEIEEFTAVEKATPLSYVAGTQVATNYSASFSCSRAQMEALAEHGFKVVSIKLGDESLTRLVGKEKKIQQTKHNASCILEN